MGLGGSSRAWYRLLPLLDPGIRAIAFDNRGTGRSDGVGVRLTLDDMVGDTLAVMDAAGVEDAHVLGVSMGGMVAQRLALEHPERVRSLILGCTRRGRSAGPAAVAAGRGGARSVSSRPARRPISRSDALRGAHAPRGAGARSREDLRLRRTRGHLAGDDPRADGGWSARTTRARGSPSSSGLDVTVIHGSEDALVASAAAASSPR